MDGGPGPEDDYGLYINGFDYPIWQDGASEYNYFGSETRLAEPYHSSSPTRISTNMGDVATIPSGSDTVFVHAQAMYGLDKTTAMVQLTALNRNPDGKDQWVGHIGYNVGSNYGFTIYADSTQAADQDFYWRMYYLGAP